MITGIELKQKYCNRVEYFKGEEVAQAINKKSRPKNDNGQDIWDTAATAISQIEIVGKGFHQSYTGIDVDDYLDWCFKEAIPGIPFLNTLPGNVEKFVSAGYPSTTRQEVGLHTQLLLDRLKKLLAPQNDTPTVFPKDVLFDPRYEFHPVFVIEMSDKLGIEAPPELRLAAEKINKTMPYYLNEMKTLLKDWTCVQ